MNISKELQQSDVCLEFEDILPLSPVQQGLFFHAQYEPEGQNIYVTQTQLCLDGQMDEQALRSSAAALLQRHPNLRAVFESEGVKQPVQIILREAPLSWRSADLSSLNAVERATALERLLHQERSSGFCLSEPPLLRFALVRMEAEKHRLVMTYHHILLDGWSLAILVQELLDVYARKGSVAGLRAVQPYRRYLKWLRDRDIPAAKAAWMEALADLDSGTLIAPKASRHSTAGYRSTAFDLSEELARSLSRQARASGFTLNTLMEGAWAILLGHLCGSADVVFGATGSGRSPEIAGIEEMVGIFINTVPVRVPLNASTTIRQMLAQLQDQRSRLMAHEHLGLAEISRTTTAGELFDTLVVFENYPIKESLKVESFQKIRLSSVEGLEVSHYPLSVLIVPGSRMHVRLNHRKDLFDEAYMQKLSYRMVALLEIFAADLDRPLGQIDLTLPEERARVLTEFNRPLSKLPETSVVQAFQEQVERAPENVALQLSGEKLSYRELNERANRLAHYLRARGVGPEVQVGLFLERSLEMVIAVLGIVKAGGIYVPLDVHQPAERTALLLEDNAIPIVLTQSALRGRLPAGWAQIIELDGERNEIEQGSGENPGGEMDSRYGLYVNYTSGSTGQPKGVLVTHASVVRLVREPNFMRLDAGVRMLHMAPLSFDAATLELWGPLLNGGAVVVQPGGRASLEEIGTTLREEKVNTVWLTAGLFQEMVGEEIGALAGVEQLLAGGDVLSAEHVRRVMREHGGCQVINGYGPTENTTFTCCHRVGREEELERGVPIGVPINQTRVYVLDGNLQLAAEGVVGELYSGGAGLARGYWQRPGQTAERFVADPYAGGGERMYRTGDLARWRKEGVLEFVGRADQQVKIRGYRIEPGEIEAELKRQAGVAQAVVVAREDEPGEKRLVAYVVGNGEGKLEQERLREKLAERLPEYMVPSAIVELETLPLTGNGKLDRNALPAPEFSGVAAGRSPRTPQEEILCELFADVLSQEQVSIDDDFFVLGGHSLMATRLVSRIRATLGVELALHTLFESSTVAKLAPHLQQQGGEGRVPLTRKQRPEHLPLSYAQQRLWFIDQLEGGTSAQYNVPEALRLRGELNHPALERALNTIIERHESLRTHFGMVDGKPVQIIEPELHVEVPIEDLSELPETGRLEHVKMVLRREWQDPFNLSTGPLLRLKLFRLAQRDHILVRTFHHVVSDGWSHGVFYREFMVLYEAYLDGRENPLEALPVQYADFALWQREWLDEELVKRELEHWKNRLDGIPDHLALPTDRPRPAVQTYAAGELNVALPAETLALLKSFSRTHHATLYMTLLSAFGILLSRYSGQDDIVVGSAIANRQEAQMENLIGFFVNSLVMRVRLNPQQSFEELLASVREMTLEAYQHQDLPFERLVEDLAPHRSLSAMPVFQVMFAVQNAPMGSHRLKGLEIERFEGDDLRVRFDLEVHVYEQSGEMSIYWIYNSDLFDRWRMQQMAGQYVRLLDAVLREPSEQLLKIDSLDPEERKKLLERSGEKRSMRNESVVELFEQQAMRAPEAEAVVCGGKRLSYGELNARANRLAHRLMAAGVGPETLVGISMERSLEMLVGVVGIVKAGGAYVPIAGDLPAMRRETMIAEMGLRHMVTGESSRRWYEAAIEQVISLGSGEEEEDQEGSGKENPEIDLRPTAALYVNYTSGSTGQPKGVLVTHASVVRLVREPNFMRLDAGVRMLHMAPLSFDAATLELWGPLLNGGAVVVQPGGRASLEEIGTTLREEKVNTVWLTAGLFQEMVGEEIGALAGVEQLLAGGDVLSAEHVRRVMREHAGCQVINGYGPTENTTFTCCHRVGREEDLERGVPIGVPINQTRVYVLDGNLQLAAEGVVGELYSGGAGLARGYWQRPGQTAERFVADPYAGGGERMYRTGDLARWRKEGVLEFVGRADQQVKIRGYRIEPGEIEAILKKHPGVQDALVVVREQQHGKQLLGYVIPRQDETRIVKMHQSQIKHWQELYESTYREASEPSDFDVTGWNSSYTGQPIPAQDMRIWVEQTVASLEALQPSRVLEIGCGTGLLLTRLAPGCQSYLGLDFSREVLSRLGAYLTRRPDLKHVQLREGMAHELSFMASDSVDLVVMNSIVQYFPDVEYLLNVLREAVRVTRPGGHIFVGDVRSLPLLEAYHASVQLYKAPQDMPVEDLRQCVVQMRYNEEELLVDAELFHQLSKHWKKLGCAQVALKPGAYDNELNRFRYDVTLAVGPKQTMDEPERWLTWDEDGAWRKQLELLLKEQPHLAIGVAGVRDSRIAAAVEAARLLHGGPGLATAGELFAACWKAPAQDRNEFTDLARKLGVEFAWRGFGSNGIYDAIFNFHWKEEPRSAVQPLNHYRQYANVPAQREDTAKLAHVLQNYLRESLPEYMIPAALMALPSWPITANGKIDRQALPLPERRSQSSSPPRNSEEEMLCEIFADVLAVDSVGIDDNFFSLGGHSLMATRLVSRIRDTLGVELALRTLFEAPTVAELAGRLRRRGGQALPPLVARPRPERLPLSHAQERLWFIDQLQGAQQPEYNMPQALRMRGYLDVPALRQAINTIVARHESLRTSFANEDAGPVQIIASDLRLDIPVHDLSRLDHSAQSSAVSNALQQEWEEPFDLSRGPLIRVKLLKLGEQEYVLLRTLHHIVSDGWSQGIFNRELMMLYESFHEGRNNPLEPLPVQYADFTLWQREWLNEQVVRDHLEYWKENLAGIPEFLDLPTDRPRPAFQTYAAEKHHLRLLSQQTADLKKFSHDNKATLFMTLLSAFAVLLARYSGEEDVVVGSPIANRQETQLEQLIGFFVNSLVMRVKTNADQTVAELIAAVREMTLQAYLHQDLPFERLVEELAPPRAMNRTPIFQVIFGLLNAPMTAEQLCGMEIEQIIGDELRVRFDLEVHAHEREGQIDILWLYNRDLFNHARIVTVARHFEELLRAMAANPSMALRDICFLTTEERRQIVEGWNQTQQEYPREESVHALFQQQARMSPDATAVAYDGQSLTYQELDQQSNRLAWRLLKLGVRLEGRVGICMERGPAMIVSLLGVLKAGGAYVPLDPEYPTERLRFMVADAGIEVVITQRKLAECLSGSGARLLCMDAPEESQAIASGPDAPPEVAVDGTCLAYVTYTSSSTGVSKGVQVEHHNVVRLVRNTDYVELKSTDRIAQISNFSFDAATFEIWGALLNGATLVGLSRDTLLNGPDLGRSLREEGITAAFLTTALFNQVSREAGDAFAGMRYLLFGGEAMDPGCVRTILRGGAPQQLTHVYGVTETTTFSTWFAVQDVAEDAMTVPIGKGLANVQTYVLDPWLNVVPSGVTGELYVGGEGVGRGYLNRPGLTAEKFIPNPYACKPGDRLYKTGDLVRWTQQGVIEFVEHADQKVKIRGFRIEPGEIEVVLGRIAGVKQCALRVREDKPGEKRLVAYVALDDEKIALAAVQQTLQDELPGYMLPSAYVELCELPLTPDGELDRNALPPPELSHESYLAPRTEEEKQLCNLIAEMLNVPRVGINDNFFSLGGHSLIAMRLINRLRTTLGYKLPIRALFEACTIGDLARHCTQKKPNASVYAKVSAVKRTKLRQDVINE